MESCHLLKDLFPRNPTLSHTHKNVECLCFRAANIFIQGPWSINYIHSINKDYIPCTAEWTSGRMNTLCSARQQGDTPGNNG